MKTPIPRDALVGARRRQRGTLLTVAMLLLLFITLTAMIGTRQATVEARLAGNNLDRYLALQAAEAALREGEALLEGASLPAFTGAGLYAADAGAIPDPLDFDVGNSLAYSRSIAGVAEPPRYIVQELGSIAEAGTSAVMGTEYYTRERVVYRVTALGYGRTPTTRVVLQSTFRR